MLPPTGMVRALLQQERDQEDRIYELRIPVLLQRCGVETKLIVEQNSSQETLKPHADSRRAIQEALKKGLLWNNALVSGEVRSTKELANKSNVSQRYVSQLIKMAYLSPAIINQIFKGDIPHDLTLGKLKRYIPLDWTEQKALFS